MTNPKNTDLQTLVPPEGGDNWSDYDFACDRFNGEV
jgi:hypothetical protein